MVAVFPLKVLLLTLVLFVTFAVAGAALTQPSRAINSDPTSTAGAPATPLVVSGEDKTAAQTKMALALLATCLIHSVTAGYLVIRSRWSGFRLIVTILGLYFGTMAVMSQIEAAYFMPEAVTGTGFKRMLIMQFVVAAVLAPAAVGLFDRGKLPNPPLRVSLRKDAVIRTWTLAALTYVILYLLAGYYFVWTHPIAREFYGGADAPLSLALHSMELVQRQPQLILLQIVRGFLWIGLAVPVVLMWRGPRWEAAIALALLFGVAFPALLLLPNPSMPAPIRMLHLVEVSVTNVLYGLLIGWSITTFSRGPGSLEPWNS